MLPVDTNPHQKDRKASSSSCFLCHSCLRVSPSRPPEARVNDHHTLLLKCYPCSQALALLYVVVLAHGLTEASTIYSFRKLSAGALLQGTPSPRNKADTAHNDRRHYYIARISNRPRTVAYASHGAVHQVHTQQ